MAEQQFRDQNFGQRYQIMGDKAEGAFEQVADARGWKYSRKGFNRPPFNIQYIPLHLRYEPDYATQDGLIECQGVGRDGIYKLKREKLSVLEYWNNTHPVSVFVWHSTRKKWTIVPLAEIVRLIDQGHSTLEYFHEGKAYFAIPISLFGGWESP